LLKGFGIGRSGVRDPNADVCANNKDNFGKWETKKAFFT
jgi:hypothetical protein